ncbi:MAG: helix-turn-helix domain-containing protein [Defluviitaleaceae bacterium]|nr:helix-turn-helix domain-containing protein [Defluviitaleaceae bacterium]
MALFNVSALICEMRKAKGLTQAQLAEGICSRQTISAIEKGNRKPDWFTFKLIMHKLGVDPNHYFNDMASADDVFIQRQVKKLDNLILTLDWDGLKVEHDNMEKDKRFSTGEGRRALLGLKANLYNQGKYSNPQLAIEASMERLKINRPHFKLENAHKYILTYEEQMAINALATVYYDIEAYEQCIALKKLVLHSLEKNNKNSMNDTNLSFSFHYFIVATGLCLAFKEYGMYEDCIAWADKAIKLYNGSRHTEYYIRILRYKAFSLLKLGQEEGKALYKKALLYAYIFDEYLEMGFESMKSEYNENFGDILDLSLDM